MSSGYQLLMRQHPIQARLCSFKEKVDRRPVDPPPIVQVKSTDGRHQKLNQNSHLFLHAFLVHPANLEEVRSENGGNKCTAGTVVQSPHKMKDMDGSTTVYFAFPDLSLRVEGTFKLKFVLFEMLEEGVMAVASCYSSDFKVVAPKCFPGMSESTALTRHIAEQGFKLRVRKKNRATTTRQKRLAATDGRSESDSPAVKVPKPNRRKATITMALPSPSIPLESTDVPITNTSPIPLNVPLASERHLPQIQHSHPRSHNLHSPTPYSLSPPYSNATVSHSLVPSRSQDQWVKKQSLIPPNPPTTNSTTNYMPWYPSSQQQQQPSAWSRSQYPHHHSTFNSQDRGSSAPILCQRGGDEITFSPGPKERNYPISTSAPISSSSSSMFHRRLSSNSRLEEKNLLRLPSMFASRSSLPVSSERESREDPLDEQEKEEQVKVNVIGHSPLSQSQTIHRTRSEIPMSGVEEEFNDDDKNKEIMDLDHTQSPFSSSSPHSLRLRQHQHQLLNSNPVSIIPESMTTTDSTPKLSTMDTLSISHDNRSNELQIPSISNSTLRLGPITPCSSSLPVPILRMDQTLETGYSRPREDQAPKEWVKGLF